MKLQRILETFLIAGSLIGLAASSAMAGAPLKGVDVKLGRNGQPVATTRTDPAGGFTFANLQPGNYDLHFGSPVGNPSPTGQISAMDDWHASASVTVTAREAGSGMATGRSAAEATAGGVVMPRDHASGMATGKRMHKPFSIRMELGRASPMLAGIVVEPGTVADLTGNLISR